MKLYLFVKSKCAPFVGTRYSMRDLLSDLNNYAWLAN